MWWHFRELLIESQSAGREVDRDLWSSMERHKRLTPVRHTCGAKKEVKINNEGELTSSKVTKDYKHEY